MKLAYFDCFSGIIGDMTLGALLDAGVSLEVLRASLRRLNVPGWSVSNDLFKIRWSHLGNPGVVVGCEAGFLLQGMNLALHSRHLVV